MIFPTKIRGIPCQVDVIRYTRERNSLLLSNGECFPPEDREFEFNVYNIKRGSPMHWLKDLVTPQIEDQLVKDYLEYIEENRY